MYILYVDFSCVQNSEMSNNVNIQCKAEGEAGFTWMQHIASLNYLSGYILFDKNVSAP